MSVMHVLSEVMKTIRQWIHIILSLIQNATIFTFYYVLNTIKSNFKAI